MTTCDKSINYVSCYRLFTNELHNYKGARQTAMIRILHKCVSLSALPISAVLVMFSSWQGTAFAEGQTLYVSVETGQHFTRLESSGRNLIRAAEGEAFDLAGDDEENGYLFSGKVGADTGKWRFDLSYKRHIKENYETDSFRQPVPTFFNVTNITLDTFLLSTYYDFFEIRGVRFFAGVGAGYSHVQLTTFDGITASGGSDWDPAAKIELGLDYNLTDSIALTAGARYIHLEASEEAGVQVVTQAAKANEGLYAGVFNAELYPREIFLGLRYSFNLF